MINHALSMTGFVVVTELYFHCIVCDLVIRPKAGSPASKTIINTISFLFDEAAPVDPIDLQKLCRLEQEISVEDLCRMTGSRAHARFSVHHIHKVSFVLHVMQASRETI